MFTADQIIALKLVNGMKGVLASIAGLRAVELTDAAILIHALASNLAHIDEHPELADQWVFLDDGRTPVEFRRPTPVRAIAEAMGLSHHVVRERVRALAEADLAHETAAGVVLQQRVEGPEFGEIYITVTNVLLREFFDRLVEVNSLEPALPRLVAVANAVRPPQRSLMRITAGFIMDVLAAFTRAAGGDVIDGMLALELVLGGLEDQPLRWGETTRVQPARLTDLSNVSVLPLDVGRDRLAQMAARGAVVGTPELGYRMAWPASGRPEVDVSRLFSRLSGAADVYDARVARAAAATKGGGLRSVGLPN